MPYKDPADRRAWNKSPKQRARHAAEERRYRADPKLRPRHRAREKLRDAIKAGRIKRKPCEVCRRRAQAHHEDYSKPFKVRWFCHKHHIRHHYPAE